MDPAKIWSSTTLPTLPAAAVKLLEMSRNPETEIRDIADVIKRDPALSAKILKSANSTFFGLSSKVSSVDRAVPLLGTTLVTSMALSFSLSESAMSEGPMAEHYRDYWWQSVVQASAAECCAVILADRSAGPEFFQAGLLMDLGRLAMLKAIPKDYRGVLAAAKEGQRPLSEVEQEMFGFDHTTIGTELMKRWQLPQILIDCSSKHHNRAETFRLESMEDQLTVALAIAAAIGEYYISTNKGQALQQLRKIAELHLKYNEEQVTELLKTVDQKIADSAGLFELNSDELGDPTDLMAEANAQLAHLAVREHVASTQAQAMQHRVEQEKQELMNRQEQLQREAFRDPLTGALNRRFFDESMAREVDRSCRYNHPMAVMFADVDKFKSLNDTYGHAAGDEVLKVVAKGLRESVRKSDILARYGGEEFVCLVSEPTEKGLEKLAERIRARVESETVIYNDLHLKVTISVGAAMGIPRRNDTDIGQKLLHEADEAMYDSKQNGRNRVNVRFLMDPKEREFISTVTQKRFSRWLVRKQVLDMVTASKAILNLPSRRQAIGELAVRQSILSTGQVDEILDLHLKNNERFGETAVRLGYMSEDQVAGLLTIQQEDPAALAKSLKQLNLLDSKRVDSLLLEYLSEELKSLPAGRTVCVGV